MKLKVCGLLTQLDEVSALKPAMMGFIFYPPSPRYVLNTVFPEDLNQIPKGIQRVGVFVNASVGEIKNRVRIFGLSTVQLHGDESPEVITELQRFGVQVIKVFRVEKLEDLDEMDLYNAADYFLFDTRTSSYGGSGRAFDWELLHQVAITKPFFLSGGITPQFADRINSFNHPYLAGVDINSGFEIAPGVKNIAAISSFQSELKIYEKP